MEDNVTADRHTVNTDTTGTFARHARRRATECDWRIVVEETPFNSANRATWTDAAGGRVKSRLRTLSCQAGRSTLALLLAVSTTTEGQASRARTPVHAARACGVERWRVKILADDDRGRVVWSAAEPTSITALRRIPAP